MTRAQPSPGEKRRPLAADKLLGKIDVKLRLALASGLVLAAGALLAPRVTPRPCPRHRSTHERPRYVMLTLRNMAPSRNVRPLDPVGNPRLGPASDLHNNSHGS
jgi:hypothetical protein